MTTPSKTRRATTRTKSKVFASAVATLVIIAGGAALSVYLYENGTKSQCNDAVVVYTAAEDQLETAALSGEASIKVAINGENADGYATTTDGKALIAAVQTALDVTCRELD